MPLYIGQMLDLIVYTYWYTVDTIL